MWKQYIYSILNTLFLNTYMHIMINMALLLLEMHRNMTDDDTRMQEQGEDVIMKGKMKYKLMTYNNIYLNWTTKT